MKFSVVIPTRNNEAIIGRCLQSLSELDYPKDDYEVILGDSMSTDLTRRIAEIFGVKVVDARKSVCAGRNAAFEVAKGEFIAISDADCTFDKDWLKNALKYFDDPKVGGIGGANLIPENESAFGKAVGFLFAYAPYVTKAAHTRVLPKVIESRSHGSNAIYRASVLRQVIPIDETLVGGEDVIMNDEILDLGYKLLYVPDVLVYHYRRPNIKSWWKSMYRYGMGRVILPRHRKGEVTLAHIITGWSVPILVAVAVILALINIWLLFWFVVGLCLLVVTTFVLTDIATHSPEIAYNMPIVLFIFITAWSFGYIHETFSPEVGR
jgi:cellulose synthase/poly-beta-1,6-N-acetylglucosamine synthase-like glycosyltransferase